MNTDDGVEEARRNIYLGLPRGLWLWSYSSLFTNLTAAG
jgi:hypothetical protein